MSSQLSSARPLSQGTERAFECIDLKHHYPVPLYLTREVIMDNVRHGAKNVNITYRQLTDENFKVKITDDGDGKADASRIIAPSEENGNGTSRYGHGLRIYRLKSAGRDEPWSATWKTVGDSFYQSLDQKSTHSKPNSLKSGCPWETPESHGFSFETKLKKDALDGHHPSEIAPILREILCASMTPETLASIRIHIEVLDKEGNPFYEKVPDVKLKKDGKPRKGQENVSTTPRCLGVVDSVSESWPSILTVLENNQTEEFPYVDGTLSTKALIGTSFFHLKNEDKHSPVHEFLPYYTSKKAHFALIVQDGFITEVSLEEALDRAPHASSLNGRFAVVKVDRPIETIEVPDEDKLPSEEVRMQKEAIRQQSILEPASSKMTFFGPVYNEAKEFLRKVSPKNWVTFKKKTSSKESIPSTTDGSETDSSKAKPKKSKKASKTDVEEVTIPIVTASVERLRELATMLLAEAKLHGTDTFNVPLDALEDWVENGNSNHDEI